MKLHATTILLFCHILVLPGMADNHKESGWKDLFNGKDLSGFTQRNGTATYKVVDGTILGTTVKGSPNSFLCTDKTYGDFELTFEVKCHNRLNSGVQIRSKTKNDDPNRPKRPPSGFAKPSKLSPELCAFLGRDNGTELARTEVTKEITKYIREKNLQDPTYKRRILCDTKLGNLLQTKEGDEVTYFNLQTYLKPHYIKAVAT